MPTRPVFLASAPVDGLDECIELSLKYGGEYSAGDATDKLDCDILDHANDTWKTAWKGKTSQTFRILQRLCPGEKIIAVAIRLVDLPATGSEGNFGTTSAVRSIMIWR